MAGDIDEKQVRLQKMRDLAAGLEHQGAQPLEDDNPTTRRIRMLENRLDKAMIKYNEDMKDYILSKSTPKSVMMVEAK